MHKFFFLYLGLDLPGEAGRHIVLGHNLQAVGVDGGGGGRALHGEEGLDGVHLHLEAGVGEGLPLGGQSARGQPLRILVLLANICKDGKLILLLLFYLS